MNVVRLRAVGAIVIAVFAVLPVSASLCAAFCAPAGHAGMAAAAETRQEMPSACHEQQGNLPQVNGVPGHDCTGHEGPVADALVPASPTRVDAHLIRLAQQLAPSGERPVPAGTAFAHSGSDSPPGGIPPTRAPLVLRI